MKEVMEQFVCARLVQANRLDLTRFQFDYDLTFAIFFMNADGTIYGRYGARSSQKDADKQLSVHGLIEAMKGALALHKNYPANKTRLAGKQPRPTRFKTPDDFPTLKGKYKANIDYKRNTSRSCLHCHQIIDAQRSVYRNAGKPIPDSELFIYPMPETVGFSLDPGTRATVAKVFEGSAAEKAGLRPGDDLISLNGQAILSIADVQWVLHHAKAPDRFMAKVQRKEGKEVSLTLELDRDWRRKTDIAWRVSSWPLRRMGTGGLVLSELSDSERKKAELSSNQLAMRVEHVGQFGAHAAAKRAGFRKGDILISFNGQTEAKNRSEFLALVTQTTRPGQRAEVVILRQGRRIKLRLPMQK